MIKKIFLFCLVFFSFLVAGLFFQLPIKKTIETQIINDPKIFYEKQVIEKEVDAKGISVTVHAVGVYNTSDGGEVVDIIVSMKNGTGKNFFDSTGHTYGTDIQEGIEDIRSAVEKYTLSTTSTKDIYIDIGLLSASVSGTSGNAFIAVGLVSLLENKIIDAGAILTGSISPQGTILPVGQLREKLKVVEKAGYTKFLIPKSQCDDVISTLKVEVLCVGTLSEAAENILK